jgi:hypothetical protein
MHLSEIRRLGREHVRLADGIVVLLQTLLLAGVALRRPTRAS